MNKGFHFLSLYLLLISWSLKSTLSPSVQETFCNKSSDLLVANSMKYMDQVSPYFFRLLSSLCDVGHALPFLNPSFPWFFGQWLSFGFPPTYIPLSSVLVSFKDSLPSNFYLHTIISLLEQTLPVTCFSKHLSPTISKSVPREQISFLELQFFVPQCGPN